MIEKSVFPREVIALIKKLPPPHLNSAEKEEVGLRYRQKCSSWPQQGCYRSRGTASRNPVAQLVSCLVGQNMMAECDVLMGLFQSSSFYDNHKVEKDLNQIWRALKTWEILTQAFGSWIQLGNGPALTLHFNNHLISCTLPSLQILPYHPWYFLMTNCPAD